MDVWNNWHFCWKLTVEEDASGPSKATDTEQINVAPECTFLELAVFEIDIRHHIRVEKTIRESAMLVLAT